VGHAKSCARGRHQEREDDKRPPAAPAVSEDTNQVGATEVSDERDRDEEADGTRCQAVLAERDGQEYTKEPIPKSTDSSRGNE
jgi:hypothetical protein